VPPLPAWSCRSAAAETVTVAVTSSRCSFRIENRYRASSIRSANGVAIPRRRATVTAVMAMMSQKIGCSVPVARSVNVWVMVSTATLRFSERKRAMPERPGGPSWAEGR